jgi:hypothetical protein
MRPEERIQCSEVLLRAIRERDWRAAEEGTRRIRPTAFMRRVHRPEPGVSVFRAALVTPEECVQRAGGCIRAVASLHTGAVRDLGLTVEAAGAGGHATILGVPDPGEDPDEARTWGALLRSISRLVWVREGR